MQFKWQKIQRAVLASLFIVALGASSIAGQSTKGGSQKQRVQAAVSPVQQIRQQQQPIEQTRLTGPKLAQQEQQQQQEQQDPLADSEPAIYGSVAGQPGIDFPAYTRVPKTSFSCANKQAGNQFDFGFYADEEAQCQVYHVCWQGRHESFLCGVGTVFNQAILACDYWHSVDCSKSSQFYSVNSELGKAGAEPSSAGGRVQASNVRPASDSTSSSLAGNYNNGQSGKRQQQQYVSGDDDFTGQQKSSEGASYSQQQQQPSQSGFVPQRTQPQVEQNYQRQQARLPEPATQTKGASQSQVQVGGSKQRQQTQQQQPTALASPSRQRFNMDLSQKVNSLIESPVRAPLKSSAPLPAPVPSKAAPPRAQQPVARLQQAARRPSKTTVQPAPQLPQPQPIQPIQQVQQQQQAYDNDHEEQLQQVQQQFDEPAPIQQQRELAPAKQATQPNFSISQQQVSIVHAGGSGDGSSAITTSFDTIGQQQQAQQQQQQQQQEQQQIPVQRQEQSSGGYDQSSDDQAGANDDFRSAGAKAAASQNQNWYIMRSI